MQLISTTELREFNEFSCELNEFSWDRMISYDI